PPSQDVRGRNARMKLIPIEDIIYGQRLIICEDSNVPGTQLKNLTIQKLWGAGAAQVHVRVACPPLMFPCNYNLSTRGTHELIARRAIKALEGASPKPDTLRQYLDPETEKYRDMVEWMRRDLNCTSLDFLTLPEVVDAIGLPGDELCTCCWSGEDTGTV
ncbi:MAG: amidophosphoribosyltransferase, partial [Candidatus Pacebacteria bacterium]|nr:amidophosphoribosyltransferase [Candidatus Paceibacterota bacterium]